MASKKSPLWRGSRELTEQPDSPEWDFGTQQIKCTRIFAGPYEVCLAKRPPIHQIMQGFEGLPVESVKVKKAPGGKGIMTVSLETQKPSNQDLQYIEPFQPVYEIEWTQIERPIEQNPVFKNLFPDPTIKVFSSAFVSASLQAIANFRAWESQTDPSEQTKAYNALSDSFKVLAQRKMLGETSYLSFAPVVRITTLSRQLARTGACGKITEAIPDIDTGDLPTGYKWLSTADRCTRTGTNGKWQRVREWMGAEVWDELLYGENVSPLPGGGSSSGSGGSGGSGGGSGGG